MSATKTVVRYKRPPRFEITRHMDPLVRLVLMVSAWRRIPLAAVGRRAGIAASNLTKWRSSHSPTLSHIVAAVEALDMELIVLCRHTGHATRLTHDQLDKEECLHAKFAPQHPFFPTGKEAAND